MFKGSHIQTHTQTHTQTQTHVHTYIHVWLDVLWFLCKLHVARNIKDKLNSSKEPMLVISIHSQKFFTAKNNEKNDTALSVLASVCILCMLLWDLRCQNIIVDHFYISVQLLIVC